MHFRIRFSPEIRKEVIARLQQAYMQKYPTHITMVIVRHSKPIAELIPFSGETEQQPAWKQPGIKLALAGVGKTCPKL